jgi:hypothetical protein
LRVNSVLLKLKRFAYLTDKTAGFLVLPQGSSLPTVELPWSPSPLHRGGANLTSCVPDGTYKLEPYSSDKHPNVWSLSNPNLDVYVEHHDIGRYGILIHVGNSVADVVGCIAVGMDADPLHNIVRRSREAIEYLRTVLGDQAHILEISPRGASN